MTNPLQPFERLAEQARRETLPEVNVAGRVLHTLRVAREPLPAADAGWLALAAASLLVAGVVTFYAVSEWQSMVDPMISFLQPFSSVLP